MLQSRLPISASYCSHKQALLSVLEGFLSPYIYVGWGFWVREAAHRVDAAVAAVFELALAVCAGLCCEDTGEEDEAEADDGDHVGC